MNTHQCYIQKTELQPPSENYIFFDIEAMQETGFHEVDLIVAQYMSGKQYNFQTTLTKLAASERHGGSRGRQ